MTTTLEQQIKAIQTIKPMIEELKKMHFCTEKRCTELSLALVDVENMLAKVRYALRCLDYEDEKQGDFLESGEKLVVFGVHKFVVDRLMGEFKEVAVKIDGSTSMEQRNSSVESFQNNPEVKLFVGNIKAAGVGLTLTAASNVAFMELPWNIVSITRVA